MAFQSCQEILKLCEKESWEFWEAVARDDQNERGVPPEEAFEKMRRMWRVMVESSENYDSERRSNSGLVGGDGGRMFRYAQDREPLSGYFMGEVIAQALCMGESNAKNCRSPDSGCLRSVAGGADTSLEEGRAPGGRDCTCTVYGSRNRSGDRSESLYCRSVRWVPGRDWNSQCYGGRSAGTAAWR